MESKQKYTEGEDFELDEFFLEAIHNFKEPVKNRIAKEIDKLSGLQNTNDEIKVISGVVHDDDEKPTFFSIEYFRAKKTPSILIDIYPIELNNYLDAINTGIYIK